MERICPKCNKVYSEYPALSREDNETMICPDCGVLEALETIGIIGEEAEHILNTVNQHKGENEE